MTGDNHDLSERELEILKLVATGASNKEIAHRLAISTNTVKVHLRNIYSKIGVTSRTEAAMYAVNAGLVPGTGPIREGYSNGADLPATSQLERRSRRGTWLVIVFVAAILGLLGTTGYLIWKNTRSQTTNLPQVAASQWKENAPMLTARYGLAVAAYENYLYTIAGENSKTVTTTVERYDPSTDTWQAMRDKPTAVSDVRAAILGGKIYVPGGRLASGKMTNAMEIYDPRLDTWFSGAQMPAAISAYALASFEGKLYLFGGWDGSRYLSTVYEYDPENDTWSPETDMPTARAYSDAAVAASKIYVFGGYDGVKALAVNEDFLPDRADDPAHSWEVGVPMPVAGYAMGVASVADTIYIIGGLEKPDQPLSSMFTFQDGVWNTMQGSIPGVGSNLGLINLSSYLYAVGGKIKKTPSNINLSYKALYTISVPLITK